MADDAAVPDWLAGERRRPTPEAMLGAIGGLVVLAGISALFSELPDEDARLYGLALSLLTLVVGCVLSLVRRDGALGAAGVALAAGAVLPLVVMVVERPEDYEKADVLVAGLLAVVAYGLLFVGSPARGHGLFLGLGLLALWVSALSQTEPVPWVFGFEPGPRSVVRLETEPIEIPAEPFEPPEVTFAPRPTFTIPTAPPPRDLIVPPPTITFPTPTFVFPSPSTTTSTSTTTTTTIAEEQSLGRAELAASTQDSDDDRPPIAPGIVSLLFGAAYLGAAVVLDGARLRRLASAVVVVGAVALLGGVIGFGPRYGGGASGLLAAFVGAGFLAVGLAGRRRFLAWAGALITAVGIAAVVDDRFEEPGAGLAVALLLVGAALVAAGVALSRRPAPPASG